MSTILNVKEVNERIAVNKVARSEGKGIVEVTGTGIVLIKSAIPGQTCNGNPKYSGSLVNQEEVQYNVWNDTQAYQTLSTAQIVPGETVAEVSYTISKFGLVVNTIQILNDPAYTREMFIRPKYDHETLGAELKNALNASGLTEKGFKLLEIIFGINTENNIYQRFSKEQAAMNHHDNCEMGLLAHSVKCLRIYNGIKLPYNVFCDERTNDLMVIGLFIHDIGKIDEMKNGVYQKYSFVTHRLFGVEHLFRFKDQIVTLYDEEFYHHLEAIVDQHHDEFGEPARTMYSFVAHMIDDMEAKLTMMNEEILTKSNSKNPSDCLIRMSTEKGGDRFLAFFCPTTDKE